MAVFPEEQQGLDRRGSAKKPADLLARSGLPVPELRTSSPDDIGLFNTDFRRLVARISKLFSIIAPTVQGEAVDASTVQIVAHHTQHEAGNADEVNVTGLHGVLAEAQEPLVHDIQGAKHSAESLTAGHVLRASAPTAFSFDAIQDADLPATILRVDDPVTFVRSGLDAAKPVSPAPGELYWATDTSILYIGT